MKAYLSTTGDSSVGIAGDSIVVDFQGMEAAQFFSMIDEIPTARENVRKELSEFFSRYCDGQPSVLFEDECWDCGRVLTQGHCVGCPATQLDPEAKP